MCDAAGGGFVGSQGAVAGAAVLGGAWCGASGAELDGLVDQVGLYLAELGGQFSRGKAVPTERLAAARVLLKLMCATGSPACLAASTARSWTAW